MIEALGNMILSVAQSGVTESYGTGAPGKEIFELLVGFFLAIFFWVVRIDVILYMMFSYDFLITKFLEIDQLSQAKQMRETQQTSPIRSIAFRVFTPIAVILLVEILVMMTMNLKIFTNDSLVYLMSPWLAL